MTTLETTGDRAVPEETAPAERTSPAAAAARIPAVATARSADHATAERAAAERVAPAAATPVRLATPVPTPAAEEDRPVMRERAVRWLAVMLEARAAPAWAAAQAIKARAV
jgi:hypothetical protein